MHIISPTSFSGYVLIWLLASYKYFDIMDFKINFISLQGGFGFSKHSLHERESEREIWSMIIIAKSYANPKREDGVPYKANDESLRHFYTWIGHYK
jgi:hypothetical protein